MCKRHKAALHLLFVKEENTFVYPPGKNPKLLEMILAADHATQNQLERKAKEIERDSEISCFYHTAEGPVHKAVARKATDFYCDLILLEKNSTNGFFSLLKKNSVYKILKEVSCPVLTIPSRKKALSFKKVLFPIRPLTLGLDKLEVALPIIKQNRAKVTLFSPVQKNKHSEELDIVNDLVDKADYHLSVHNVDFEKEMNFTNDKAAEVISKAVEKGSDLIIISATLNKGLSMLFQRDYTEKIVDSSPVPVLSVKLQ